LEAFCDAPDRQEAAEAEAGNDDSRRDHSSPQVGRPERRLALSVLVWVVSSLMTPVRWWLSGCGLLIAYAIITFVVFVVLNQRPTVLSSVAFVVVSVAAGQCWTIAYRNRRPR
jgi:hypothetical protein